MIPTTGSTQEISRVSDIDSSIENSHHSSSNSGSDNITIYNYSGIIPPDYARLSTENRINQPDNMCVVIASYLVVAGVHSIAYLPLPYCIGAVIRHPIMVEEGYRVVAVGSCIIGAIIGVSALGFLQLEMETLPSLFSAHFLASFLFSIPLGAQCVELKKNVSIVTMIEDQLLGLSIIVGFFLLQLVAMYVIRCPEISSDSCPNNVSSSVCRYFPSFFNHRTMNPLQTNHVDNVADDTSEAKCMML